MDNFLVWIILGVIGIAIFAIIQIIDNSTKQSNLNTIFYGIEGFFVSRKIIGNDGNSGIAVDEQNNTVCLLTGEAPFVKNKVIQYKDILESEILEDGESLTKTSRGSQLGGVLLGGLVLGGVGAIIGGLSGKKTNIDTIKRIDLKIVINDINEPIFFLNLLNVSNVLSTDEGYKKSDNKYQIAIQEARKWNSIISILIKKADEEDKKKEETLNNVSNNSLSISDEIRKLKLLLDDGLLTNEEFEIQKSKLLNK